MTFPASQSRTVRVDRDERYEDQVRLDRRRRRLRLQDPEGARNRRIASEESKWLRRVVEGREGDNRTHRSSFLDGEQRADFASHRRITGNHARRGTERGQMLGQLLLEQCAARVIEGADEGLARSERRGAKGFLRQRRLSRPGAARRKGR